MGQWVLYNWNSPWFIDLYYAVLHVMGIAMYHFAVKPLQIAKLVTVHVLPSHSKTCGQRGGAEMALTTYSITGSQSIHSYTFTKIIFFFIEYKLTLLAICLGDGAS